MAIRSSSYYERQAEEAKKRETYMRNRPPRPVGATVTQKGGTTTTFYRSMLIKQGSSPAIFSVDVLTTSLDAVGGATACGLLATMPTDAGTQNTPLRVRGSGMKPSRAHWYKGVASPSVRQSKWGTNWTKYYDNNSHQSVPLSDATGTVVAIADVQTVFNSIFSGATKTQLLGTKNGRAYLEFERVSLSSRT
jgi:hypothetical protein